MALLNIASKITSYLSKGTGGLLTRLSSTSLVTNDVEEKKTYQVISTVNILAKENVSRAFAVVHLLGKQWKVTAGDLLQIEGAWPPSIGDEINLNKVLVAGTTDFSLIGTPLVQPGLVNVTATVIAKSLSHTRTRFRKKRRKQFMRINFQRSIQTTLRINSIDIGSNLNNSSKITV